jgi:endo-1,4-beta-D-glucanase Y
MIKKVFLVLFSVSVTVSLFLTQSFAATANKPFPQHTAYYSGVIKPQRSDMDSQVLSFYNSWAKKYILVDPADSSRKWIDFSDNGTACVSESQGYGMVITAIMGDKSNFDALYKYYLAHPSQNNKNMMAWKQKKSNGKMVDTEGADSATDGDLDAAYALLLADKQWGSSGTYNYLNGAKNIINALASSTVDGSDYRLLCGDWAKGGADTSSMLTRSSDFMLDYFRVFAKYNSVFANVKSRCEAIIKSQYANGSGSTGLMPDFWLKKSGSYTPAPKNALEGENDGNYSYNACRVPWRFAANYIMTGDPAIYNVLNTLNNWIKGSGAANGNPSNIYDGYYVSTGTNGKKISGASAGELSFIAPFMVSALISSANQEWLNRLWDTVVGMKLGDSEYYGNTIKLQCMIIASGNWWAPGDASSATTAPTSTPVVTSTPRPSATPAATATIRPTTTPSPAGSGVTFYQHANYGGKAVTLASGSYTLTQLNSAGISNDWMSSLKIPSGYSVAVYQHDNFGGTVWRFTSSAAYVGSDCNDQMSSVKITRSTGQATPNPTSTPVNNFTTWKPKTAYKVGDTVTYNGKTYKCRQSHTSLSGWEPPAVPALWQAI